MSKDVNQKAEEAVSKSTAEWSWGKVHPLFKKTGCSINGCEFSRPGGCDDILCCALNLSDALIRAGYTLPSAGDVNYCSHADTKRVRNADGMARICNVQNGGSFDQQGWANRPTWKGIVYFEGNLIFALAPHVLVTAHIDLWDGTKAVHTQYPDATVVWFWKMGT